MADEDGREVVSAGVLGASGRHQYFGRGDIMLGIVAAVLLFIAFLINAADISTNDVFTSTNVMLIGLALLALHVAGIGSGWAARGRRR
ncbi:hypothetical protein [Streptomyces fagopyri]|uniref:hypothetical protein n=1 Tax=Streptomyces fagopyri TaxID=2662397 RepID=UPI0037112149